MKKDNSSNRWHKKQKIKKREKRIAMQVFEKQMAEMNMRMPLVRSIFDPEHTVGIYRLDRYGRVK